MSSLKIILTGLLLLFTCVVLGQKEISKRKVKKYYFVTKEHDTVRCKKMEWNVLTNGKLRNSWHKRWFVFDREIKKLSYGDKSQITTKATHIEFKVSVVVTYYVLIS